MRVNAPGFVIDVKLERLSTAEAKLATGSIGRDSGTRARYTRERRCARDASAWGVERNERQLSVRIENIDDNGPMPFCGIEKKHVAC